MEKKLIIYGIGDFSKLMTYYFEKIGFEIVAYTVDKPFMKSNRWLGKPLTSFDEVEKQYPPEDYTMFVAIGYSNMRARMYMYKKAKQKGFKLVNYISDHAVTDGLKYIGENNVILANTVIEPFCSIQDNNIFWTSCVISHDVGIGSHNFFASKSLIGGFTEIKNNCFFGFGSIAHQCLKIGNEVFLGSNSLLNKDTEDYYKYLGSPARKISKHLLEGIKMN